MANKFDHLELGPDAITMTEEEMKARELAEYQRGETAEQRAAREAKEAEEKKKAEEEAEKLKQQQQQQQPKPDPDKKDTELTQEQIDAKLKELAEKADEDLTEEDKKFIETNFKEEESIVGTLISQFGFEELKPDAYEETEEGIMKLARDSSNLMAQKAVEQLFEADPVLKQHFEFKKLGGDSKKFIDTFYPETDWSEVKLSEDDESQWDETLKADMRQKGFDSETIESMLKDFEIAGTKKERASKALVSLQTGQKTAKETLIAQQRAAKEQAEKDALENWKQVETLVKTSNSFKGIPIKEAEKSDFLRYISETDEKGMTARDRALQSFKLEDSLLLDYLLFKNFDIGRMVEVKAETKKASSLKERLQKLESIRKGAAGGGPGNAGGGGQQRVDVDKIDFNAITGSK